MPAPANDTMPLPPEELGLPVLPDMPPDMAVEAAVAEPVEEMVENDTEELAAGAVEAPEEGEDDEDEDEEEVAVVEGAAPATAQKRRADDEPASFLAMYFRDMAELDVLRPEQEIETARNIEQM